MLGYLVADGVGAADRMLWSLGHELRAQGLLVAGAVQDNPEPETVGRCHMDLHILTGRDVVRISQNLGPMARGCRLDPAGLERAVGLVSSALSSGAAPTPALLIVNKFGKQELDGRGFCPVIADALAMDIPVLTAVNAGNEAGFLTWAGEMAERLPADRSALLEWVRVRTGAGGSVPVSAAPLSA